MPAAVEVVQTRIAAELLVLVALGAEGMGDITRMVQREHRIREVVAVEVQTRAVIMVGTAARAL